jgi:hypothetical protein
MAVSVVVTWSTLITKAAEVGRESDPVKKARLQAELEQLEDLVRDGATLQIPNIRR